MTNRDIPFGNLSELQPWTEWAVKNWIAECEVQGLQFFVTEVYRTQERQNQLYAQGRTKAGKVVTWTKTSMHTQRLAADVVAVNCSYIQIEGAAKMFGIYRPSDLVKLGDEGHFQFDRCTPEPISRIFTTPSVVIRRFQRLINLAASPQTIERLQLRLNAFLNGKQVP
jgi:hypothetical protein